MRKYFMGIILLCMLDTLSFYSVHAQNQDSNKNTITITGKVVSKTSNQPLSNVTIMFIDPSTHQVSGTITDKNGKYIIYIPKEVKTLSFSFEDMKTQKIKIESKTEIDVYMEKACLLYTSPSPRDGL